MLRVPCALIFCTLLLPLPAPAGNDLASQLEAVINRADYRQAHWGILIIDTESGETLCLDSSDREIRRRFEERARQSQRNLEALLSRHGIDHIVLKTDRSFVIPLLRFFQSRVKRFR